MGCTCSRDGATDDSHQDGGFSNVATSGATRKGGAVTRAGNRALGFAVADTQEEAVRKGREARKKRVKNERRKGRERHVVINTASSPREEESDDEAAAAGRKGLQGFATSNDQGDAARDGGEQWPGLGRPSTGTPPVPIEPVSIKVSRIQQQQQLQQGQGTGCDGVEGGGVHRSSAAAAATTFGSGSRPHEPGSIWMEIPNANNNFSCSAVQPLGALRGGASLASGEPRVVGSSSSGDMKGRKKKIFFGMDEA